MSAKPYRILIIEDSPEDRELYRRCIAQGRASDYVFWETDSGEEGLRLCIQLELDCILLDYQLPDLDGLAFLDRLTAGDSRALVPIVMLTGHGNEAVAVQAMKKGIDDYLVKGLHNTGLRQAVQSAIDKGALRRELEEQRSNLAKLSTERLRLIAELEQQTAALADANQRKDDFLAMLAHELRNPLAPLRNVLRVLEMRTGGDPLIAEACAIMERQVIHLGRLVDDLLDVSRIMRGRIELRKEALDVAALTKRTLETNRECLDARQHRLTVELPSAPLFIEADPVRIEQIISNLLHNAAKYTDPGGHICLSVAAEGDWAVIRVRDNGMGIVEALLPRVFDLFTQGSRSLDRSQGGLGIGLTLVKRLVELHGGGVEVQSDGPGRGSEFMVRVPTTARSAFESVPSPSNEGRMAPCSLQVMVVDDNRDAARSLATLLGLQGHRVRTAFDGLAALRAAEEETPDVLLLDIGLPELDGYEVARRLRQQMRFGRVMLIAITGYGQEEDRQKAMEAGFQHHLVKPVDPDELQGILAHAAGATSNAG